MPVNGQTVGKDVSIQIVYAGNIFAIGPNAITDFNPRPVTSNERRIGMDGKSRSAVFPDGWEGTFSVDRLDSSIEDFWASIEQNYYNGVDSGSGIITETIQNPNGSISQWRYLDVVFDLKDLGNRIPNQVIKQQLGFMASQRKKVG